MLFSIITVTLNNADGLRVTHDSLAAQNSCNFEWIVIDGASTDDTVTLLQSWHAAIGTVISEPDRGVYDAMNKGLARAQGDYVIFMNAGDGFASAAVLEKLHAALAATPADFCYGDSYETQPDGRALFKAARPAWLKFWGMFAHHQAMVYRRALLQPLNYNLRFRLAADYALTLAILKSKPKIWRVPFAIALCAVPGLSTRHARHSRWEQVLIRHGQVPALLNLGIYLLQSLVWQLKCRLPWLYRHLRFGIAACRSANNTRRGPLHNQTRRGRPKIPV